MQNGGTASTGCGGCDLRARPEKQRGRPPRSRDARRRSPADRGDGDRARFRAVRDWTAPAGAACHDAAPSTRHQRRASRAGTASRWFPLRVRQHVERRHRVRSFDAPCSTEPVGHDCCSSAIVTVTFRRRGAPTPTARVDRGVVRWRRRWREHDTSSRSHPPQVSKFSPTLGAAGGSAGRCVSRRRVSRNSGVVPGSATASGAVPAADGLLGVH